MAGVYRLKEPSCKLTSMGDNVNSW